MSLIFSTSSHSTGRWSIRYVNDRSPHIFESHGSHRPRFPPQFRRDFLSSLAPSPFSHLTLPPPSSTRIRHQASPRLNPKPLFPRILNPKPPESVIKLLLADDPAPIHPSLAQPGPMVLFATPGMLHGGLSSEVFKKWAPGENNLCIMPGYCVAGTLGHKVLSNGGKPQVPSDSSLWARIPPEITISTLSLAYARATGISNRFSWSCLTHTAHVGRRLIWTGATEEENFTSAARSSTCRSARTPTPRGS
jgi:hypothetical protein